MRDAGQVAQVGPGSSHRPRALAITRSYPPAFRGGGPAQSVSSIVAALQNDFDFFVLTGAADETESLSACGIVPDVWVERDGAQVFYGTRTRFRLRSLHRLIRTVRPSVIYLNTFFDPLFAAKLLLLRMFGRLGNVRFVVAPRGEFNSGALALKHRKKSIYVAAVRLVGLPQRVNWHATSEFEADRIRAVLGPKTQIGVAPVLRDLSRVAKNDRGFIGERTLKLLFLSRITPMKNLIQVLEILAKTEGTSLTIAGPIGDPDYWRRCQERIHALGVEPRVSCVGPVQPGDVIDRLAHHDLLVLPTLGENFGHIILESLAAGTPVLISDKTPWVDLEQQGAGWVVPLDDIDGFVRRIAQLQQMSDDDFRQMRMAAQRLAYARSLDPEAQLAMKRLLSGRNAGADG